MLDEARRRIALAAATREIRLAEGRAEELPFEDGAFDVVLSTFGAMFASDQKRTASELLRVTRRGGRIGMANWVPDGFVGDLFQATEKHVPSSPRLAPPVAWGTEERLRELFGCGISELRVARCVTTQRFRSPEHFLEFFCSYFGPVVEAFGRVEAGREEALAAELKAVARKYDRTGGRAAVITADYVEVVAVRA
jgi:SAM-dependent methyltransferase